MAAARLHRPLEFGSSANVIVFIHSVKYQSVPPRKLPRRAVKRPITLCLVVAIREIAAAAGVSVATVSRALNTPGAVRHQVRERVLNVAEELGYRPNGVARSLRIRRTLTFGAVVPTIANPHFAEAVRAMQDAAMEQGYSLLIGNSDDDPSREEAMLGTFLDRRVDGVVLTPTSLQTGPAPALRALADSGTPFVVMDRALPYLDVDRVLVDTRGGARGAVAHLATRGHRRIALIAGPPLAWTAQEKLMGYYEGLLAAGLPADSELVLTGAVNSPSEYTAHGGEARAEDLLRLCPVPDAVLVANNLMTLGVYRVLLRRRVAVPDELAVIGFDNADWTDVVRPSLTVVAQPTYQLGRRAVEVLLERVSGTERPPLPAVHLLPTRLVVRESS